MKLSPSKKLRNLLIPALLLCLAVPKTQARENAYDVLGKALTPLVNLFVRQTENPKRALQADLSLVQMTKLPAQFAGSKVELALEHPDKLIVRGALLGGPVTLCRNGQEIWGAPGSKLQAMMDGLGELPKRKKKFKLGDFELPFSEKQFVFLPVLFQAQDRGDQVVNGVSCRILDVTLMPQIAHSLNVEEWAARAWITPDYKIAKLQVARPDWEIVVAVDKLEFTETLPRDTWVPRPDEAADVLKLEPWQFKQVLDAMTRKTEKAKDDAN